ncbi:hypothetical protein ACVNIS_16865 [Sphaerotilaceae bacterium SBD11-9]
MHAQRLLVHAASAGSRKYFSLGQNFPEPSSDYGTTIWHGIKTKAPQAVIFSAAVRRGVSQRLLGVMDAQEPPPHIAEQ